MIRSVFSEKMDMLKMFMANSFVLGNSFIQWIGDADTILRLIGTMIAIPVAFYSAKSFYWNYRIKKAEALKAEREINNTEKK